MMTAKTPTQQKDDDSAIREWRQIKQWNPFNSNKLLTHVHRWTNIARNRPVPAPALITVDPTNKCNLNCAWCNAAHIRAERHSSLSGKTLLALADFLPKWGRDNYSEFGVDAICVAGGGEPLLNPETAGFIEKVTGNGIAVGVVTNGTLLRNCFSALQNCTWVGVSVDAGSDKTYNALKGLRPDKTFFSNVVSGIADLVDHCNRRECMLGKRHPSYGVSFKYLLYRDNIGEVYAAAKLAKEIGCKNIHFRPAGTTWDKLDTDKEITFSSDEIALFREEVTRAFELDDESFGVYGVTHKFTGQFQRDNCFEHCQSVFMTAVIGPRSDRDAPTDAFVMGLCCDRRGDAALELLTDATDINEIGRVWGGKKHWGIHDAIDVRNDCPRCTYQPHNQIYENVILKDSMTYKFI